VGEAIVGNVTQAAGTGRAARRRADPIGEHRAIERDPLPGVNPRLAIQRQVIRGFGDEDLRRRLGGQAALGLSGFPCMARAVEHVQTIARVNRRPNSMANRALASDHSRAGIVRSFSDLFDTRNSDLIAASSVGKCPLARTARRSFEFSASMAFVA
jgi:hypothetical protein